MYLDTETDPRKPTVDQLIPTSIPFYQLSGPNGEQMASTQEKKDATCTAEVLSCGGVCSPLKVYAGFNSFRVDPSDRGIWAAICRLVSTGVWKKETQIPVTITQTSRKEKPRYTSIRFNRIICETRESSKDVDAVIVKIKAGCDAPRLYVWRVEPGFYKLMPDRESYVWWNAMHRSGFKEQFVSCLRFEKPPELTRGQMKNLNFAALYGANAQNVSNFWVQAQQVGKTPLIFDESMLPAPLIIDECSVIGSKRLTDSLQNAYQERGMEAWLESICRENG
jgi:hypothetical protein